MELREAFECVAEVIPGELKRFQDHTYASTPGHLCRGTVEPMHFPDAQGEWAVRWVPSSGA